MRTRALCPGANCERCLSYLAFFIFLHLHTGPPHNLPSLGNKQNRKEIKLKKRFGEGKRIFDKIKNVFHTLQAFSSELCLTHWMLKTWPAIMQFRNVPYHVRNHSKQCEQAYSSSACSAKAQNCQKSVASRFHNFLVHFNRILNVLEEKLASLNRNVFLRSIQEGLNGIHRSH